MKQNDRNLKTLFRIVVILFFAVCAYIGRHVFLSWSYAFLLWCKKDHGSVADWFSAFGTISAVVVALYNSWFSSLKSDVRRMENKIMQYEREGLNKIELLINFQENLAACFEYVDDNSHNLDSKTQYLKAIVPTLCRVRDNLIADPLTQYKTQKMIDKIQNEELMSALDVHNICTDMRLIINSYFKVVKEKQIEDEKRLNELKKELNQLHSLSRR